MDPKSNQQHIFLPNYNATRVFWDGHSIAANHTDSESFLRAAGFTHIHSIQTFSTFLKDRIKKNPRWHLLLNETSRKRIKDDAYKLLTTIRRLSTKPPRITNISALSWQQRACHDRSSLATFKDGIQKTATAYANTMAKRSTFTTEYELAGHLKGELLKQTPFGLSFSPIVARNENAAILHYVDCCDEFQKNDLVLLDFGLRWQSMCTDISRTIALKGRYTPLQKQLVVIVQAVQEHVISLIKPGISFDDLNDACWTYMDALLEKNVLSKGGKIRRCYKKQPHNVGHLLGIQTHDGDPFRSYRSNWIDRGYI